MRARKRLLPEAAYDFWVEDSRDGERRKCGSAKAARVCAAKWRLTLPVWGRCVISMRWAVNERKVLALLTTPSSTGRKAGVMGNDENMAAYAQMDMRGVAAQALRDLDAAKARIAELEACGGSCGHERMLGTAFDRIAELEGALRECIYQCESCKAFGTWTATTCYAAFRPFYCDACKAEHEVEVHQDGRLVGQLVYDDWRRADRNIKLAQIYAPT